MSEEEFKIHLPESLEAALKALQELKGDNTNPAFMLLINRPESGGVEVTGRAQKIHALKFASALLEKLEDDGLSQLLVPLLFIHELIRRFEHSTVEDKINHPGTRSQQ